MSIDGSGILASDLGHDVYNEILDLYDSGVPMGELRTRITARYKPSGDPLDEEIYLAAASKAYWEIGQLDEELRAELVQLVQSGKSLEEWGKHGDIVLARSRKAALHKLLSQISVPRSKPRPRKRYPRVKSRLYSVGDCLELAAKGKIYRAVVCMVQEYRGHCEYIILIMGPETLSSIESFKSERYWGNRIPSSLDKRGYVLGPHVIRLDHQMLVREGNLFNLIGHIELDEAAYCTGSFGGVLNMEDVLEDFERTETKSKVFGYELLPLQDLLKT